MSKKALIIVGGITLLIALIISFMPFYLPLNVISHPDDISIVKIMYKGEDITDQINQAALLSMLAKLKCTRTFMTSNIDNNNDVRIEISMSDGETPLHILFGNINVSYSSRDKDVYQILDPADAIDEFETLLSQSQ